ncbi:hypothetical protein [Synechococcus sp. CBW1107]|uniref:hypothetical protein n=2 Tax=unclassified Synechococcus TaxID=2626047 RepID=UPI002AD57902|nr:hypothetical protein [Synechococcus sp. CBW1107]CAK6699015.1 hypothetical protein IFHNHDMJ_02549 [Synechococcus sp. CBW1107]
MKFSGLATPLRVVLASSGRADQVAALLSDQAPRLAAALGLPLHTLTPAACPHQALHQLEAIVGPWLAALPCDPGLLLEDPASAATHHWAEALGAWRQPSLLLLPADSLATGAPAATTALLRQWQVPLLGLIQGGGPWEPARRRSDGLPWIGWLPEAGRPEAVLSEAAEQEWTEQGMDAMRLSLEARWLQLQAELD